MAAPLDNSTAKTAPANKDSSPLIRPKSSADKSTRIDASVADQLAAADGVASDTNSNHQVSPRPVTSAPAAPQDDCSFLDKLSAELRNEIYELAFTSDLDEGDEAVELQHAMSPSNSLLWTCRQIMSEALQLYQEAVTKYWTDTPFYIELDEPYPHQQDLARGNKPRLQDKNIDRIRRIYIIGCLEDDGYGNVYTYHHDEGIWHSVNDRPGETVEYQWVQSDSSSYWGRRLHRADRREDAVAAARGRTNRLPFHQELMSMMDDPSYGDIFY